MTKQVMEINALHDFLINKFGTTKVLIQQNNRSITIEPFSSDNSDSTTPFINYNKILITANPDKAKAGALTLDDFKSIRLPTKDFKFDREEANARR
jgi:hypothetical protein